MLTKSDNIRFSSATPSPAPVFTFSYPRYPPLAPKTCGGYRWTFCSGPRTHARRTQSNDSFVAISRPAPFPHPYHYHQPNADNAPAKKDAGPLPASYSAPTRQLPHSHPKTADRLLARHPMWHVSTSTSSKHRYRITVLYCHNLHTAQKFMHTLISNTKARTPDVWVQSSQKHISWAGEGEQLENG